MNESGSVEGRLKDIKRRTRRKFSSEEKIRIVLEGIMCLFLSLSLRERHRT